MIEFLKADKYSINIEKLDEEMYSLEFMSYYDEKQRNIFNESIPFFDAQAKSMSLIPNVSCTTEIDKENLILKLKMISEFKRIADTIIGEFISHGGLGIMTISQLFDLAAMGLTIISKADNMNRER